MVLYNCRIEKKDQKLLFNCLLYLQTNILRITNLKTTNSVKFKFSGSLVYQQF